MKNFIILLSVFTLLFEECEGFHVFSEYEMLWCLRNSTERTLVIAHPYIEYPVTLLPGKSEPIFEINAHRAFEDWGFLTFDHFHKIDSINVCDVDGRSLSTWRLSDYSADVRGVYNEGCWQFSSRGLGHYKIKHINPFAEYVRVYEYEVGEDDLSTSSTESF
jgi:hypothetical protein